VAVPFLLQTGFITKPESGGAVKVISVYNSHIHLAEYANILILIGLLAIAVLSLYDPPKRPDFGIESRDVYRTGVLCIAIGIVAYGVIATLAGGVMSLLAAANELRAGEKTIPGGFLIHFAKFVWVGSIIVFGAVIDRYRTKANVLLLVVSILVSILVLLSMAGRALFIIYFASFPFLFYIKNQKGYIGYSVILIIASVAIIVYGDYLFRSFSEQGALEARTEIIVQGGFYWISQSILREFIFPYSNVLVAIDEIRSVTDVYLLELPKGILNTLPGGIVGLSYLDTLSDVNTLRYNTTGEIPVDLISLGYHTFGALGSLSSVCLCCILFAKIDGLFKYVSTSTIISLHSIIACKLCFVAMYADLHQVISGNFFLVGAVVIMVFFKEVRLRLDGSNLQGGY
jgi:uncharacterized membrane protein